MRAKKLLLVSVSASSLMLSSCGSIVDSLNPFSGSNSHNNIQSTNFTSGNSKNLPKGGGYYKVGTPYSVNSIWYYPKEDNNYNKVVTASWYGPQFHGRKTANGEIFDMNYPSAAHTTLPMPSYARVTNLSNGRSIVVRINDRGPFAHSRGIDLSKRSAQMLDFMKDGTTKVKVEYIGKAPLNGDGDKLIEANKGMMDLPFRTASLGNNTNAYSDDEIITTFDESSSIMLTPGGAMFEQIKSNKKEATASLQYSIQVSSHTDVNNALRLAKELKMIGVGTIKTKKKDNIQYYRVMLGPYDDILSANNALGQLKQQGHSKSIIHIN